MHLPKNKHLVIFDFDETLCATNGKIQREDSRTGQTDFLTPGEYSSWREDGEYDLNPTRWTLNFSEFQGYPAKGEVIEQTFSKLRQYIEDPHYVVSLVTGRDELLGPHSFLRDNYINTENMILMCSGDPNKRMCYESLINTLNPHAITIYEDSVSYIKQCEEICAKYEIPCAGILIGDGSIRWDWRIQYS